MPFGYNLLLTNQAKKELARIKKGNPRTAALIANAISQLGFNPGLGDFLHGDLKGRRKVRVGDYRIIYRFERDQLIIMILRIAHRKEVYR